MRVVRELRADDRVLRELDSDSRRRGRPRRGLASQPTGYVRSGALAMRASLIGPSRNAMSSSWAITARLRSGVLSI